MTTPQGASPPPPSSPPATALNQPLPTGPAQVTSAQVASAQVASAAGARHVGMADVLPGVLDRAQLDRPPVVEFHGVTKTYHAGQPGEFTAIRNVSFVVEDLTGQGEFVCVLGPSGCGKSTILRLIAGLGPQHPCTTGTVRVFGQPVTGAGADRGMVFQDYTSFDHRTVLDNVTFGLECRGMSRRERADLGRHWIERVGLDVARDAGKYPHQLSGGMRQRVAIARSLILKPRILLMDEPFGALDPMTRMNMQDLLLSLFREIEGTVFFITHSIEEAVFLGDRVYILSNSPGTMLKEMQIEPSTQPSKEMQRQAGFQETVYFIRDFISSLEETHRAGT